MQMSGKKENAVSIKTLIHPHHQMTANIRPEANILPEIIMAISDCQQYVSKNYLAKKEGEKTCENLCAAECTTKQTFTRYCLMHYYRDTYRYRLFEMKV